METYKGTFRKLIAWQTAKELAKEVYRIANKFPSEEKYGLSSQMKRASISIMSNLAEGNQRATNKDALNFFNIAFSSLTELDNQSEVAYELGYMTKKDYEKLIELINKEGYLIFRLIESKKNPDSRNSLNSPKSPDEKGFSLTELIVVIAIISIMSVSAVVGFRYMGDTLRTKEAKGVISDAIKKAEMEVMREEYVKNTIYFLADYLVIVSEPEEATLDLEFDGTDCVTPDDSGNMIKTDGEGNRLSIDSVTVPDYTCDDFTTSSETEWRYQLASGSGADRQVSDIIRFIHFNVLRENPSGITIDPTTDVGETITIEAPYGKKTISDTDGEINITVKSPEGHEEDLTVQ